MGRTPIIALLVALGVAAAPPAHAAVPVKVALRSLERNDAARDGRLTVRVAARRGTRVRVDAGSATRARTLRFRRTAGRTIRLRLTPAGRRALRACGARRLTVSVTGTRRGQRTRRQTRRLLRGTRPCRPDAPTAPGASPAPSPAAAAPGPPAASRPAPGEGSAAASATPAPTPGPAAGPAPEPPGGGPGPEPPAEPSPSGACDPLDDAVCLYPWPNEYFTAPDPRAETGRRLALAQTSMPRNAAGKPIVALDYNRADGFSPGSALITKVPGLDTQAALDRTGAVPITDMARYADPAQPVVVIDAVTRERHLIWAEIDVNPADPADRTLIVRPGKNFKEGRRYIAALRNLVREDGSPIEASAAFRTYRDAEPSGDAAVEARRPHLESLFATLGRAGIARSELFLAWDFTIASAGDRAGRMLSIRDRAFAGLGDTDLADGVIPAGSTAPPFTIDSVEESTIAEDPKIARTVKGTVRVPCFLANPGCATGGRFALDPLDPEDDAPIAIPGNVYDAGFTCRIPHSALTTPARPSLYGHGLFGGRGEVESGQVSDMASEHGFAFCAADWIGMATEDVPNTATILNDLSNFPTLADRVQQGMLDFLFLGRAMIHPDGFGSDPAFRNGAGAGVLDTRELFYDGNSQGGIIGGSLMAVSPDARRGVLGVPAMNYSTLLQRSIDFVGECPGISYSCPLYLSYPNEVERQLLFGLIQQLWDRSESNGYAQHMTDDPYPNTPPHSILMHPAYGDHQVANVAAEVQARTIGARIRRNPIAPGRHTDVAPFFGIERTDFPFAGSAYEIWDSGPVRDGGAAGTGKPPTTNTPPTEGRDPHGEPRATPAARRQKAAFLARDGRVTDQCAGGPCFSRGYTGR